MWPTPRDHPDPGGEPDHTGHMPAKIVFGVMSATQPAALIDQLADLLAPHLIVVHHDFRKRADFAPSAPNVVLVPDPKETGWGSWGLAEGVFHTVRYALEHLDFDYFQLISPTCLPIRPLAAFERFVETSAVDANVDLIQVDQDDDTLMHYAYRTYVASGTLPFRLLRRIRAWYFEQDTDLEQLPSLSRLVRRSEREGRALPVRGHLALAITRAAARGWLGRHPFSHEHRPMVGGLFFGARRRVCDYLVGMSGRDGFPPHLRALQIVDESVFPTLLGNSRFRLGPSNHSVNHFTIEGNPRWINDCDLDRMFASGRFFGRKFPEDLESPIRRRAIECVKRPEVAESVVPVEHAAGVDR
jgi:hypothetical protein